MRAVVQRVKSAKVLIDNKVTAEIGPGIVVFVAIGAGDQESDGKALAEKIANLRIFDDAQGKMNRSLLDLGAESLVVSEFTLYGDCSKGRRPNYVRALAPEQALQHYMNFVESLRQLGVIVATGEFKAMMQVELVNDGPVTLLIDGERKI